MTAKTSNTDATRKDGIMISCPMLAAEIIYKGTPTFAKASGSLAFSNDGTTNTLANGDTFLGISVEEVDNSTGAASAEFVRTYIEGTFLLPISDTITQANVGDKVYVNNVSDDITTTITSDAGNPEACIGVISEFVSANSAYVKIDGYALKKADSTVGDIVLEDGSVTAAKLAADAVETAKILNLNVTEAKLAANAVAKAKLKYEVVTVTITGAASGTGTAVTGGQILGFNVTAVTSTAFVKTVVLSGTTITVTLSASDTATVDVIVLKA